MLRKENCLEDVICIDDDGDTVVDLSQDQDLHSFVKEVYLDQGYLSPIPVETAAHTMEESIEVGPLNQPEERVMERSSEVEEMETLYVEESDAERDQQTAKKVAVVDEEDATGEVHEKAAKEVQTERLELNDENSYEKQLESVVEDVTGEVHEEVAEGVQPEILELNEENSIEKQLASMGEGSQPSSILDKEPEEMGKNSSVVSALDVNSNRCYLLVCRSKSFAGLYTVQKSVSVVTFRMQRNQRMMVCQLCGMEMVKDLQVSLTCFCFEARGNLRNTTQYGNFGEIKTVCGTTDFAVLFP